VISVESNLVTQVVIAWGESLLTPDRQRPGVCISTPQTTYDDTARLVVVNDQGQIGKFTATNPGFDGANAIVQISGPGTVYLQNADLPCATFTPTVPGTLTFRATLDGSRGCSPDSASNALMPRREQVLGPEATVLESADPARATFTPTIAGTSVFRLSILNGNTL